MKKLIGSLLTAFFLFAPLSPVQADSTIVRIVSPAHQTFTGEFRNDDLAQELTPSGRLGQLVYVPVSRSKIWIIDPALIDEVVAMTGEYKLATDAEPLGSKIASDWLTQLQKVTRANEVIAPVHLQQPLRCMRNSHESLYLEMEIKDGLIGLASTSNLDLQQRVING